MSLSTRCLWLNLGSHLSCLHRPLLRELSFSTQVAQWDYASEPDEPASLDLPLALLHDYLRSQAEPLHLAGHGMSGVLGLLYARRYPERVKSLTLLGVGPDPAISWQSHYYGHRRQLRCDRTLILSMMVSYLLGESVRSIARELVCRLQRELDEAPSPHSLLRDGPIPAGGISAPLLVCGSQDDPVITPERLSHWQLWMKPDDRYWQCPGGRHFFHYFYTRQVSRTMVQFWQQITPPHPGSLPVLQQGQDASYDEVSRTDG
jgi:pimeloyl-ACP methyl ester carboxylesterase